MSKAEPAALFDATRLGLLARLADGQTRSLVQMGEGLPISRQAVAKHLEVLRDAAFVQRAKSGREVHFALRRDAIEQARDWLGRVAAQWDGTLARLKDVVERE